MREIKFRYWDMADKKLDYFDLVTASEIPVKILKLYPIMQYTDLLDKNGKEIYEGDIVKYRDGIGEIMWYDQADMLGYHIHRDNGGNNITEFAHRHGLETADIEIIGNIYENPELLTNQPLA